MSFFYNEWILIPILGICAFIISYLWSDRILAWLYKRSLGNREYILEKLDQMFVETNRRNITLGMLLLSFGLGAIAFVVFWPKVIPGLLMGSIFTVLGWSIPKWLVDFIFQRRMGRFNDQMVDGLTIMANGVRSGLSVPQAMERVVENIGQPMSQEFNLVLSQTRLGLSLEEALNNMAQRLPTSEVQMFVMSVNILRETGGNLGETFSTIVETIRERQKVEKKIEALTAQGIMQGIIITMVPFVLLFVFLIIDPGYVKPLFSTTLGVIFLFVMLGLQVMGGLMIRNIVKIRV